MPPTPPKQPSSGLLDPVGCRQVSPWPRALMVSQLRVRRRIRNIHPLASANEELLGRVVI